MRIMTPARRCRAAPGTMPGVGARMGGGALRLLLLLAVFGAVASPAALAREPVSIDVLSNRAELISGNDALIAVNLPRGADASRVRVTLDGRDVSNAFAVRPNGKFEGLLKDLRAGRNELSAKLPNGDGARIAVANHPIGGPVFSGPQIQPWRCLAGAVDAQCNRPVEVRVPLQAARAGAASSPTTPRARPPASPTTTTDQGKTVPFIVRLETGLDRPRPVPHRRALRPEEAVGAVGAAGRLQPQAGGHPRRELRHRLRAGRRARRAQRDGARPRASRSCRTRSTTPATTATSRPRPSR